VRDTETGTYQMTLMTLRTHAASVLQNGRIEVLQARRLYFDDKIKIGVVLNDSAPVHATYYLQIFDRLSEDSVQRQQQILIDAQPQYFYSSEFIQKPKDIWPTAWTLPNRTEMASIGLPITGKLELFPAGRKQIYVRLENIDDNFDKSPSH